MSVPDIIVPIAGTDLEAFVYIDAVEITRQGSLPVPGMDDRWRIALPIRAVLSRGGQILRDSAGNEFACEVPAAIRARLGSGIDLARLIHHPQIAALVSDLRDTCLRIATGDLAVAESSTP